MTDSKYKIEERTKENGTVLFIPYLCGEFGWTAINGTYDTYQDALYSFRKLTSKNSPTVSKVEHFITEDDINNPEVKNNVYNTDFRVVELHYSDDIVQYQLEYKIYGQSEWKKTNEFFGNMSDCIKYKSKLTNIPLKLKEYYL